MLHLDGTVLTIPADAIAADQLDYLKSFALRAAAESGRLLRRATDRRRRGFHSRGSSASPMRVTVHDLIWLSNEARGDGIARRVNGLWPRCSHFWSWRSSRRPWPPLWNERFPTEWPRFAVPDVLTPTAALALAAEVRSGTSPARSVRNLRAPASFPNRLSRASPLPVVVLERHLLRRLRRPRRRSSPRAWAAARGRVPHLARRSPDADVRGRLGSRDMLRTGLGQKEDEAM